MAMSVKNLILDRMSRFFRRNIVIAFENYLNGGNFDVSQVLGQLNALHDPEILKWLELLSVIGDVPTTLTDLNLYVSPNGSDTATGTQSDPFLNVSQALDAIPHTIDHTVRILLISPTGLPVTISDGHIVVDKAIRSGSLHIYGVGTPQIIASNTISNVVQLGNPAAQSGTRYEVVGAGWSPYAYQGMWIRPTSGAAINRAFPIQDNDADNLYTRYDAIAPIAGDTFDIIRPLISWAPISLTINLNQAANYNTDGYSRMSIRNLIVDQSATTNFMHCVKITGQQTPMTIGFSEFIANDTVSVPFQTDGSYINTETTADPDVETVTQSGIVNYSTPTVFAFTAGFQIRRVTKSLSAFYIAYFTRSQVRMVSTPFAIVMSYSELRNSVVGFLYGDEVSGDNRVYRCCMRNTNASAGIQASDCQFKIIASHVRLVSGTGNGYSVYNGVLRIDSFTSCDPSVLYGLKAGFSRVVVEQDGTLLAGSSGDILFSSPNPDIIAPWPAAGASATDNIGSIVTRPA